MTNKIYSYAQDFNNYSKDIFIKKAIVKKLPNGKWTVMSLKGKQLGEYKTKQEAVKNLRRIEFFKNHKKKASKDKSYSSIMRDLKKSHDDEDISKFQREFKRLFDAAVIEGSDEPENVLQDALQCISEKSIDIKKIASAIGLGDARFAGKYLADLVKFLLRRISPERRVKSIENLRKKIYYLNEYQIASKKTPASSALGHAITLLKTVLLEHNPLYIRNVLNNIVKYL